MNRLPSIGWRRGWLTGLLLGAFGVVGFAGGGLSHTGAGDEKASPVGKQVENFRLRDFRGAEMSLSQFADKKVVVLAFLGCECPLAKLYAPRLVELAKEYDPKGVAFLGVNSNQQDSVTEIGQFAKNHKIVFPILKDVGNLLADAVGAVRTPEVFVLDGKRVIRYRGGQLTISTVSDSSGRTPRSRTLSARSTT